MEKIMQNNSVEELLKQQVNEMMDEQPATEPKVHTSRQNRKPVKKKKHTLLKVIGLMASILLVILVLVVGTKRGRRMIYQGAGNFIYNSVNNEDVIKEYEEKDKKNPNTAAMRQEDYVTNYLIFGIEEFGGARNTDSMMIASLNTKDNTIKLTSLLRDSYVEIPGYKNNKLNSAYARGGAKLLIDTIELNYKIKIDGYASVNFKSFEKIVDRVGGVTIELGKEEAEYLNKTNYISKKKYRNVKPGVNKLNGNQLMGYCRVRKVKTLGGVNDDYGRVLRQQRALKAIFESYITTNVFKLPGITKECLNDINTNVTEKQIADAMEAVVENRMKTIDTLRIPVDGAFESPKKYNGIGYPILLDWDVNRVELFKFIYGDTEAEAKEALATLK
jgi:LCP family protein required for cell wall assembly